MVALFIPIVVTLLIFSSFHYTGILGINLIIIVFFSCCLTLTACRLAYCITENTSLSVGVSNWFRSPALEGSWEFCFNSTNLVVSLVVVSIGFVIQIYSMYYMGNDNFYASFLATLSLFVFFMLFLVNASQWITLFVGWEGVGICSFFLINFWGQRSEANQSAMKAVVFNKIGDLSLIVAVLMVNHHLQIWTFLEINILVPTLGVNIKWFAILLLLAAFGKSAQFFFHLWLTDAMEGPTPVSGLIHSATMVIAGVFLIIQTLPLVKLYPLGLVILMLVGVVSSLVTSLAAVCSFDIKRIIANSTAAHLGLMFMALSLGGIATSLFHLTTHAYFKAFGFLLAGYIIHLYSNEQDCRQLGGFFSLFPLLALLEECWCFTMLSLPISSNYYSKELFLKTYWQLNQLQLNSLVSYGIFLICLISILCSSLYVGFLLGWLGDKITFLSKKYKYFLKELNWVALSILLLLSLISWVLGFMFLTFFNNHYWGDVEVLVLANWSEGLLLATSFIILGLILLVDYLEDKLLQKNRFKNRLIPLWPTLQTFSLDNLASLASLNSQAKGFSLFYSVDNFIVETSTYFSWFKKISYYMHMFRFSLATFLLFLNFTLVLSFLFFIVQYLI